MAFDFPNAPALNQEYHPSGGPGYKWDGIRWLAFDPAPGPEPTPPTAPTTDFPHKAAVEVHHTDVAPDYVRIAGYLAAGDGGQWLLKKVGSAPAHGAKIMMTLSGGGTQWYEKVPGSRVSSHANLDAFPPILGDVIEVVDGGRSGLFDVIATSSIVGREVVRKAADTLKGVYAAVASYAGYSYRRRYDTDYVMAEWFGAVPFVFGGAQDSTAAFQACADFAGIGGAWRWKGLHRLTATIVIRDKQDVGSFGVHPISLTTEILSNAAAFTGPNTGAGNLDSTLFYDGASGTAMFKVISGGTAEFHDFTCYGRGYLVTDGSKNMLQPDKNVANWHDLRGILYSKHISAINVNFYMFTYALQSAADGANQGNYYSKFVELTVYSCLAAFRVDSVASYNTEVRGCRFAVAQFALTSVPMVNFKVIGGVIESYSESTVLRNDTDLHFFGTYFETTTPWSGMDYLFTMFGPGRVLLSFIGCRIYLNNHKGMAASAGAGGPNMIVSHGNRFRLSADAGDSYVGTHVIYNTDSSTVRGGSLFSDMLMKDPANTHAHAYINTATPDYSPFAALTVVAV